MALALNLYRAAEPINILWFLRHPWQALAMSLCFGALAFINSWDFPVYAAILAAVTLAKAWADQCALQPADTVQAAAPQSIVGGNSRPASSICSFSPVSRSHPCHVGLALPAVLHRPDLAGLGHLALLGAFNSSLHFALVIGLPALLGITFLWPQTWRILCPMPFQAPVIVLVVAVAAAPLILWLILASTWGTLTQGLEGLPSMLAGRTFTVLPVLSLAGLAGYLAFHRLTSEGNNTAAFPLLLLAGAFYLLAGAELFHLVDFFGNRMNTVFKVYYQAWLILGIVGAYGIYCWLAEVKTLNRNRILLRTAWACVLTVLLVAAFYYPVGAILDRTGLFREGHSFQDNTLDGLAYIQGQSRGEYAAIAWLRDEAAPGNLIEAVGEDYSEYGRISGATGRPAVLGWKGHEHQWRGTTRIFSGREEDIAQIYQSTDPTVVRQLLDRYDVRYVYLGHRERAKYGIDRLPAAEGVLETAFSRHDVTIYQRFAGP